MISEVVMIHADAKGDGEIGICKKCVTPVLVQGVIHGPVNTPVDKILYHADCAPSAPVSVA